MKPLGELVVPAKSAVIVVDVQNDFCRPDGALGKAGQPTADAKARVLFVRTIHEAATDSDAWTWRLNGAVGTCCRKDTWGAEYTEVGPLPDEPVIVKHRYSAFVNTRLDSVLRTLKIENVIMTGVSTNVCVESTARHGFM